jgi:hypothetical protein
MSTMYCVTCIAYLQVVALMTPLCDIILSSSSLAQDLPGYHQICSLGVN